MQTKQVSAAYRMPFWEHNPMQLVGGLHPPPTKLNDTEYNLPLSVRAGKNIEPSLEIGVGRGSKVCDWGEEAKNKH
jgi:hypothetical protein